MNIKKLTSFFTRKRMIWGAVALVVIGIVWLLFFRGGDSQKAPLVVHAGEFLNQISVSGKITATQNIDLSFEQPGIVRGVYAKVGDNVVAGKLIATQDTAELYAQSAQMQAGIDLQKAKLNQLLAGASGEDIKVKVDAVVFADQDLKDAYNSALADMNNSYNAIYNAYTVALHIRRTYFNQPDQPGVNVQNSLNDISNSLADAKKQLDNTMGANQDAIDTAIAKIHADLNTTYIDLKVIRDQCDLDIYYTSVSATDKTSLDTQKNNINTAVTTLASAKQSITSYKTALKQAQNQLEVIKAVPRITDTAVYDAQIKQAEASLQEIYAKIRKKQIIAPISGTLTVVDAKVGSIAGSGEVAVSIISNGKFQIESYVPEIYISSVKIGNEAKITLDAYGPDNTFRASVVSIDPSETLKDGVSSYKTMLQFTDSDENVKDGMSANVVIVTNKKEHVISIPRGLVIIKGDKKIVKVLQGENVIEKEVQTGEISSLGNIEIISGIKEGDVLPLN